MIGIHFAPPKLSDLDLDFAKGLLQIYLIVRRVESRVATSFHQEASQGQTRIRGTLPGATSCSAEVPSSAQHAGVGCTENRRDPSRWSRRGDCVAVEGAGDARHRSHGGSRSSPFPRRPLPPDPAAAPPVVSVRMSDGRRVGRPRVTASSATRIDRTFSSMASVSTTASGSRARMARYRGTLLITVPPNSRIRARTAGVTSARISTITSSFAAG